MDRLPEAAVPPQYGGDQTPLSLWDKLGKTWPARLAQGFLQAAALPGDVYQGNAAVPRSQNMGQENIANLGRVNDLSQSLFSSGIPMAQKGAAGIFGGRLAQTADLDALKLAEAQEANGRARDAIWKDTGWGRGADDKWRFEIPDNAARMKTTEPGLYRLPEVLDHPEFYKAYPDAANMHVELRAPAMGGPSGQYVAHEPREHMGLYDIDETMAAKATTPADTLKTLLHEGSHAVQQREGFAKGGSPGNFNQQDDAQLARDALSFRRELAKFPKGMDRSAKENAVIRQYQELGAMDWLPSREARDLAHDVHNNPDGQLQELVNLYGLDHKVKPSTPTDLYKRLAGEAEARNVPARKGMTPEERLAQPPWSTEDVPRDQQIIRGKSDGPQAMIDGPNARAPTVHTIDPQLDNKVDLHTAQKFVWEIKQLLATQELGPQGPALTRELNKWRADENRLRTARDARTAESRRR